MSTVYEGNTLWGNNDYFDFKDVEQGNTGNCYIMASLGVLSEYPDILQKVFLINEENDVGIYAFRFFIRGKPWIVTIDDIMPFNGPTFMPTLHFAQMGNMDLNERAIWAPLLEKAWAKIKGSYMSADGGFIQNGIRALTGCPVFTYWTSDITDYEETWTLLREQDIDGNYLLGAATSSTSGTKYNSFGVANGHAFSILSVFPLRDTTG